VFLRSTEKISKQSVTQRAGKLVESRDFSLFIFWSNISLLNEFMFTKRKEVPDEP